MGRDSAFQHTQIIQLPLPAAKPGEDDEAIIKKGIEIGIHLLHDAVIMINYDNKAISHERIDPSDSKAVNVQKLASRFEVPLLAADDPKSTSSQWKHFQVREDIPVVMGMTKKIVFHTALRYNNDGMEALSDPGSSVTIYGRYLLSVSEINHRCLQLTEMTYMHCPTLLSWYIKSTMIKAHEQVNAYYKEKFVEAMSGKSWT